MKKEHRIVMLPTEKAIAGCLSHNKVTPFFKWTQNHINSNVMSQLAEYKNSTFSHLYLISDDKIKEGDWFVNLDNDHIGIGVCQLVANKKNYSCSINTPKMKGHYVAADIEYLQLDGGFKKVIASTDPELKLLIPESLAEYPMSYTPKRLPQFSDDFIQAYINARGIDKVMVEYEVFIAENNGKGSKWHPTYDSSKILKLREDNTVIISQIKSSYTRADMIHALTYGVSQSRIRMSHAKIFPQYKKDHL